MIAQVCTPGICRASCPSGASFVWSSASAAAARRTRGVSAVDDARGSRRAWRLYEKLSPRAYPGGRFEAGLARLAVWERRRARQQA